MINRKYNFTQKGQSIIEFLVVFPIMLILIFGIIQFALLYQVRATLNHATMLAARGGALHNGDRSEMRAALAKGLTPLFATADNELAYAEAWGKAKLEVIPGIVKIEVLNPSSSALNDFGKPRIDGKLGAELPNDTLSYRTTTPGSSSKISIQDANILHVRVTYCARLIVPVVDRIIYSTVNAFSPLNVGLQANGMSNPFGSGDEPLVPSCLTSVLGGKRIEIKSEAFVRMQSPFFKSNL